VKFIGTTILTIFFLATWIALSHAQSPTLTQVYGPASVPPGCRAYGCPRPPFFYLPPFLAYAAPPIVIEPPPVVELPPPPVAAPPPGPVVNVAPPPIGWVYRYYAPCADPDCKTLVINVGADGLNFRVTPDGPVIGALANGVPVIPLQRQGNWVLVAPGCTLAPTYTWSVTAGVPLSICL
jgi:hypothetical protein